MTEFGMNKNYIICDQTFSSKEIIDLCSSLRIRRKVQILAPKSKYYKKDLDVIKKEYSGRWYQVEFCTVNGIRKYTFPNNKIQISNETLLEFESALKTRPGPKDYINREFKEEDIIFYREFFRVKRIFGGFMIIESIKTQRILKVTSREATTYLIIDDPIVHLHI